jgi:hypothetical protein
LKPLFRGLVAFYSFFYQLSSLDSAPTFHFFIIDGTLSPQSRAALRVSLERDLPRIFPDAWLILHHFHHPCASCASCGKFNISRGVAEIAALKV